MRLARTIAVAVAMLLSGGIPEALAQNKPRPRPVANAQPRPRGIQIGGYAMFGRINFTASESFDAIAGDPSGSIFGGGARIGLPLGGLFVDVG
ncbi:MAG: hypothetical protein ABI024_15420, partial [Vicinamibacterales bacterium]